MENVFIEGSGRTPKVSFDANNGILEISGRSIPENSIVFYQPLFNWLNDYMKNPPFTTNVIFKFEYFNTSSSKCILDILRKLENLSKVNEHVYIRWYYEEGDEDMEESGRDFKTITELNIELVPTTLRK